MPFYSFENPNTKEIIDVWLKISDDKVYVDENNLKWDRIFTSPNMMIDSKIDPFSKKAFLEKTKKGGSLGDLFDLSKEMSEKRGGVKNDPIKKDYSKEWKKKRNQK